MDGRAIDRLSKRLARTSRRDIARALLFTATALPLTPVRVGRAELAGVVVLGGAELPSVPNTDTALAAAEAISRLEVSGQIDALYALLHADAQAIVPRAAVAGWYEHDFPARGADPAVATKVRFIPWTWQVNGKHYPEAAEVAYRQTLADGTIVRDEVRLVQDSRGEWRWFFGRDRVFVEEQIARYG